MKTLKKPVELNATIYNRLVKVFNDASNGYLNRNGAMLFDKHLKSRRSQIIELRKQFPTYQELKDSGIKFVDYPQYLNESGEIVDIKSWMGSDTSVTASSILDASVVYGIDLCRGVNVHSLDPVVVLKIRGTPKEVV